MGAAEYMLLHFKTQSYIQRAVVLRLRGCKSYPDAFTWHACHVRTFKYVRWRLR